MSRSVRKHNILKYGCCRREIWRYSKKRINRFNRRNAKMMILAGEDVAIPDTKLCVWDWDYVKTYVPIEWMEQNPELKRK